MDDFRSFWASSPTPTRRRHRAQPSQPPQGVESSSGRVQSLFTLQVSPQPSLELDTLSCTLPDDVSMPRSFNGPPSSLEMVASVDKCL